MVAKHYAQANEEALKLGSGGKKRGGGEGGANELDLTVFLLCFLLPFCGGR